MQVSYSGPPQEKVSWVTEIRKCSIFFQEKKKTNYSVGVGYDIKVSTWKGIELLDIYRNLFRQQRPCKDTIEDKKAEKIQNLGILIGLRAGYTTVIDTVAKMEQSFVSRYWSWFCLKNGRLLREQLQKWYKSHANEIIRNQRLNRHGPVWECVNGALWGWSWEEYTR